MCIVHLALTLTIKNDHCKPDRCMKLKDGERGVNGGFIAKGHTVVTTQDTW